MKKILIALILSLLFISTGYGYQCDKVFPSIQIRYGQTVQFNDQIRNYGRNPFKVKKFDYEFNQTSNYGEAPTFSWSNWIKGKRGIVNPGESGELVVSSNYTPVRVPRVRSKDSIYIKYKVQSVAFINGQEVGNWKSHVECQPYEITWCGDGVLDTKYGEVCDPNDSSRRGWGNGGCSDTCQPIVRKNPECSFLTATPTRGEKGLTSRFTCDGLNASSYRIDIKDSNGKVLNTINSKTGSYTFNTPGNYTAQCYADNITSSSCEQTVNVVEPKKECSFLTATPTRGEKGLTSRFTCDGLNASSYRIDIKDSNGKVLNTINSKTGSYTFNTPGNYTVQCYADNVTSLSCEKDLIVEEKVKKQCDQIFPTTKIRYNPANPYPYKFYDKFINSSSNSVKITGFDIKFELDSNFGAKPNFSYTQKIKDRKMIIVPNETLRVIESTIFNMTKAPTKRASNNIYIEYLTKYKNLNNGKEEGGEISHLECQPYEVTWCGDGILDTEFGEVCDPNDTAKTGWGTGGCSYTCEPIEDAVCEKLDTKLSVVKGEKSTFTCDAKNANDYNIKIVDSKGNLVKEIFGSSGEYTFTEKGDYVASCYINGKNTTQNTCVKPIKVNQPLVPKIRVDKTDNNPDDKDLKQGNDTQTILENGKAIFKIKVENNGTENLEKIYLVDDVLDSTVDAPDCDRTIEQVNKILKDKFGRTYLEPGESFEYTCERPNESKDPENGYINEIKVWGTGVTSKKTVEDEDPTKVIKIKSPIPKIKVDKTDKNPNDKDGKQENDTQTINKSGTAIFKIEVTNNGAEDLENVYLVDDVLKSNVDSPNCDKSVSQVEDILKTIGNKDKVLNIGESFSYTCERQNVSSDTFPYTNKITVWGTGITSKKTVEDNDTTVVKIKTDGTSPNNCRSLVATPDSGDKPLTSNFTCSGDWHDTSKYQIDIKDSSGNLLRTINGTTGSYRFTSVGTYTAKCSYVEKGYYHSSGTCETSIEIKGDETPPPSHNNNNNNNYCGDGILQRPNDQGKNEECDLGSRNGRADSWCSSTCEVKPPITIPGEQYFEFGPKSVNVIGVGMNPYTTYGDLPYVKNNNRREGEIYVYEICITNESTKFSSGDSVINRNNNKWMICDRIGRTLKLGEKISMSENLLRGIKSKRFASGSYDNNVLVTTIKTKPGGISYENSAFLSSGKNFVARVAKSTVSTTGGGTSYIADRNKNNISDASKITTGASGVRGENKNFVGLSLVEFLTSYSKNIDGKNEAEKDKKSYSDKNKTENINGRSNSSNTTTSDLGRFKEYNGITGAYILKNQNFEINSTTFNSSMTGPRTYIIEGGDLKINSNIDYSENIAFVLKGGNIIVGNSVTKINGTYISIPYGSKGGEINGNTETTEQLVINGSLYGDTSDLISKRTYMKVNSNGQLDVGTVVSFGSSVFRKPAPLTSTFVDEYIEATKVAQ